MDIIAIKKFRHKHNKGEIIMRGEHLSVDEGYGQDLIQSQLAVKDTKAVKEYQNKMLGEFLANKQPVNIETPEQRTQGLIGPTSKSEKPETRTMGKFQAKEADSSKTSAWSPIPDQGPPEPPKPVAKPNPKPELPITPAEPVGKAPKSDKEK